MSTENSLSCPLCQKSTVTQHAGCSHCGATAEAVDLAASYEWAITCFRQWQLPLGLKEAETQAVAADYEKKLQDFREKTKWGQPTPLDPLALRTHCWDCGRTVPVDAAHCPDCGVVTQHNTLSTLRKLQRVCNDLNEHLTAGRITLQSAHACYAEGQQRMGALRAKLSKEPRMATLRATPSSVPPVMAKSASSSAATTAPPQSAAVTPSFKIEPETKAAAYVAKAAANVVAPPPKPSVPKRSIWEILLDPQSLQWLLGLGGAMLVVGLVIWLATLGVFKNPLVVAACLAAGNLALLFGGWFLITNTRYQIAGRACSLLASLVMPLNLWFYSAQSLLTLDGHLWVAALVICVLYAASAYVLRDSAFVYVLHAGVALAGLLMLADAGRFAELGAPAALLVILGLIAIHVERAFPDGEGPFTRRDFGLAFFFSGHVLLASGLLFLLGGQLSGGWFYQPFFKSTYDWMNFERPYIVTSYTGQLLALALVLAGTYAYLYSDLLIRRVGLYMYGVVFTLLWAEVLTVELLQLNVTLELVIVVLAATSLVINSLAYSFGKQAPAIVRAGPPLGLALCAMPVLLGLMLHLRTTLAPLNESWLTAEGARYAVSWTYVFAMVLTAVACRWGAFIYRRDIAVASYYFVGTAAGTLMAAAAFLSLQGIHTWASQAPLVMLIPIAYVVAARLYRGHSPEQPLLLVAHIATGVMVISVLGASLHLTPQRVWEPLTGDALNLLLAAFFAETALFYILASVVKPWAPNAYLAAAAFVGALWQLLNYYEVEPQWYTLVFALIGFALLVAYRLAAFDKSGLAQPAYQAANAIMSLSFVAAVLQTLSRLATGVIERQQDWSTVLLLGGLVALSLGAATLVRQPGWRGWYLTTAVFEGLLLFLTLHLLTHLNGWQKLEVFLVVVGGVMLVSGHIGWYREQNEDRHSDTVGFCLGYGSLLAAIPLAIGLIVYRLERDEAFALGQSIHEVATLAVATLLLALGAMCQVRATAFTGAATLAVYVFSLLLFVHIPERMKTVGMMLTLVGAGMFTLALVLSMYRDRLVQLPEKIKRREGIFQVLSWR